MSRTVPQTSHQRAAPKAGRPSIGVGVIGLGTVGASTVKVLAEHQQEINRRLGCRLELKAICSRTVDRKHFPWLGGNVKIVRDWRQVVADPAVEVVVELVGNLGTAHAIALAA